VALRHWLIFAVGLTSACLSPLTAPTSTHPGDVHLWVFHIAGGRYTEHIQLFTMGDDAKGQPVFRSLASRTWDGRDVNDFANLHVTSVDLLRLHWTMGNSTGDTVSLSYTVVGDTGIGQLTLSDGSRYPAFGVRFDSTAVNLIAPTLFPTHHDSQPVIMIRVDDAAATDRDFLQRLNARGLTAEIAVPTRLVGQLNRMTWQDIRYWGAQGMGVALHSRYHLWTGAGAQHFMGETVGGFAELAAHGLPSTVFVQPGTWRDSIYFDSPSKIRTWRGALLRTFATVAECYVYPYYVRRADSLELGLSHATISDGSSDAWIRSAWQVALRPNHATVFLVHTFRLKSRDQLDWFLDLVADAKARGIVRVAANSQELF